MCPYHPLKLSKRSSLLNALLASILNPKTAAKPTMKTSITFKDVDHTKAARDSTTPHTSKEDLME